MDTIIQCVQSHNYRIEESDERICKNPLLMSFNADVKAFALATGIPALVLLVYRRIVRLRTASF